MYVSFVRSRHAALEHTLGMVSWLYTRLDADNRVLHLAQRSFDDGIEMLSVFFRENRFVPLVTLHAQSPLGSTLYHRAWSAYRRRHAIVTIFITITRREWGYTHTHMYIYTYRRKMITRLLPRYKRRGNEPRLSRADVWAFLDPSLQLWIIFDKVGDT